ncbi:MAG: murein L,D-transpeptidase family protein [Hyphomicrobium sp.]|nr:murein L,D-transpeptidase family protein [Hyphomicrobium sp.]
MTTALFRSLFLAAGLALAGCGSVPDLTPAEQPLPKETLDLIGKKGMQPGAPIFVRIFKEESELEVWKARDDGRYYHFKTYPICNWSGELGPKLAKGDKQAPEGFYSIKPQQMKPDSSFHVAFNLGFPNAYDRAHNRTGEFLMVHGKCTSAGCYAMTDALAEEIYALAREAFRGGQQHFEVHAFPFRMTNEKLDRFRKHKWHKFWSRLKDGYDYFETYRVPPNVAVCERQYHVNVAWPESRKLDADGVCPAFQRPQIEPFVPKAEMQQIADQRITVPGPKSRDAQAVATAAENVVVEDSVAASEASAWTFIASQPNSGSSAAPEATGAIGPPAAAGLAPVAP